MAKNKGKTPDFVETGLLDPVAVATGANRPVQTNSSIEENTNSLKQEKKKAGFYLSSDLLDRFNRAFYELKLEGLAVENKSALLEAALELALADMNQGDNSRIRLMLTGG